MTVVVTLLCYSFEVLGKQLNHKYFSKWKLHPMIILAVLGG